MIGAGGPLFFFPVASTVVISPPGPALDNNFYFDIAVDSISNTSSSELESSFSESKGFFVKSNLLDFELVL
jgi:hypothetical protein